MIRAFWRWFVAAYAVSILSIPIVLSIHDLLRDRSHAIVWANLFFFPLMFGLYTPPFIAAAAGAWSVSRWGLQCFLQSGSWVHRRPLVGLILGVISGTAVMLIVGIQIRVNSGIPVTVGALWADRLLLTTAAVAGGTGGLVAEISQPMHHRRVRVVIGYGWLLNVVINVITGPQPWFEAF